MLNVVRRFREWREREKSRYEEGCRRSREGSPERPTEIRPLPLDEAKLRAEDLLADPEHFQCETAPITEQERRKMELLAPHLRTFFERYSEVKHVNEAGEYLERSLLWLEPPIMENEKVSAQFLTIGWMGGEDTLIVKHGEEVI